MTDRTKYFNTKSAPMQVKNKRDERNGKLQYKN